MLKKLFGGKKKEEGQQTGGGGSRGYPGADFRRTQQGGNAGYPGSAYIQQAQPSMPPQPVVAGPVGGAVPYYGGAVPYAGGAPQQAPGSAAQQQAPPTYAAAPPPPYYPPQGAPQQAGIPMAQAVYYPPGPQQPQQSMMPPPPYQQPPMPMAPPGGSNGGYPGAPNSGAPPSYYYQPIGVSNGNGPPFPPQQQQQQQQYMNGNGPPLPPQQQQYMPAPQMVVAPNGGGMQQPQQGMMMPAPSAPPLPEGMEWYNPTAPGSVAMSSSCQGRKRALFIGICYFGTRSELRGCVNDVKNLHRFLKTTYGLRDEDTKILTDDPNYSEGAPTRANITQALHWLVQGARPGDSLFLHYSGYDETILPLDFERAGEIVDDDLHAILVRPLARGVRLTAIFDSCHSGSVLDLPFSYKVDGSLEIVQIDNRKAAVESLLSAGAAYLMGNKTGAVMQAMQGLGQLMGPGPNKAARARAEREKASEADVVQFGGCRDDQTSADAQIAGRASGAMSHAFVEALRSDPHQPYTTLLKSMRRILQGKYSQIPQLSTSHPMDLRAPFTI